MTREDDTSRNVPLPRGEGIERGESHCHNANLLPSPGRGWRFAPRNRSSDLIRGFDNSAPVVNRHAAVWNEASRVAGIRVQGRDMLIHLREVAVVVD